MSFLASALIVTWVAILLLALVVSGLVRQVHGLTSGAAGSAEALGPRPGTRAPEYPRLAASATGTLVLLFLSEDCRSCAEVFHETVRLSTGAAAAGVLPRALYRTALDPPPAAPFPVLTGAARLFDAYDVPVTPFAVMVDADGRVRRSVPVGSAAALRELLDLAAGRPLLSARPEQGEGAVP